MEQFKPKTVEATAKENINCDDSVQFDTSSGDDQIVVAKWEARSHSIHLADAHLINSGESEAIASTAKMMAERYARWQEQQVRSLCRSEETSDISQDDGWNAQGMPIREALKQARDVFGSSLLDSGRGFEISQMQRALDHLRDHTIEMTVRPGVFSRGVERRQPCGEIEFGEVREGVRFTMGNLGQHGGVFNAPKVLGDPNCINNARSPHLQCAVNPTGDCAECPYFEKV